MIALTAAAISKGELNVQMAFMTGKIIAGIYWQALRLWFKRCPVYPHPDKRQKIAAEAQ